MHVLPRIISEWTMNVICKPTAGSTTSISRFLKTNNPQEKGEMYSVTEKTIWNMKQALLKQKPQLSLTLWDVKNSFLCTQRQKRRRSIDSSSFNRGMRQPSFFPRNMSLRIILKGDRIWSNNRSFRSIDGKRFKIFRFFWFTKRKIMTKKIKLRLIQNSAIIH